MCLLILQKDKKKMRKTSFYQAHKLNPDGIGILVRGQNKKIKTYKFFDVDLAWEKYESISDYDIISVHFRLATSGGVSYDMLHPFSLGAKNGGYLLHNGVIGEAVIPRLEGASDTASLAAYIRQSNFTERQLFSYPIRWFLENVCGVYNKFLVITPNKYIIYNEKSGHWKDGIWYSNDTYKVYNKDFKGIEEDDDVIINWTKQNII